MSDGDDRQGKIDEFVAITGAKSREVAGQLLAVCNDNLEMAINMHMEGVDPGESPVPAGPDPGTSGSSSQQAEDVDEEDGVRAPLPQKREMLIQPGFEGYALNRGANLLQKSRVRSVFDGFRNFSNEAKSYSNPAGKNGRGKKRTLEELFKPPLEVMFKGDFQSARDAATDTNKWLMVNIQDACEFQCQVLNRDVWSNDAVKAILRQHFVFWQQYKESEEAQRYLTFYPVSAWPSVSVMDPRTGEQLVTWNKLDPATFCDLVSEFLAVHPSLDANGQPSHKKSKTPVSSSIVDADEDDQIAAAIRASLAEADRIANSDGEELAGDLTDGELDVGDEKARVENPDKNAAEVDQEDSNDVDSDSGADDWRNYLGDENDESSNIVLRFPDGKRETKTLPCSSQFKALSRYIESRGFTRDKFEIITNFPRKVLSDLADDTATLKDLGLFPRETVFIHQR